MIHTQAGERGREKRRESMRERRERERERRERERERRESMRERKRVRETWREIDAHTHILTERGAYTHNYTYTQDKIHLINHIKTIEYTIWASIKSALWPGYVQCFLQK